MEGRIKIFLRSLNSIVSLNPNLWQVWCYYLSKASHSERKIIFDGQKILLKVFQFICDRYKCTGNYNMNPLTFRDQLDKLKKMKKLGITFDENPTTTRHKKEVKIETLYIIILHTFRLKIFEISGLIYALVKVSFSIQFERRFIGVRWTFLYNNREV